MTILKENNEARREVNLDTWHKKYSGKGINILLLDLNGKILPRMKPYTVLVDPENVMLNEAKHNSYTMQVLHESAFGSKIYVAPWSHSKAEIKQWLIEHPNLIHIANISMSTTTISPEDYDFFNKMGIIVCVSSGNDSDKSEFGVNAPANLEWTIAIGSFNWIDSGRNSNDVVNTSNGGVMLDCLGLTNIWVEHEKEFLFQYTGTSTACPFFVGMLAVYMEYRNDVGLSKLTWQDVKEFIRVNCRDLVDGEGKTVGKDFPTGNGLMCMPKIITIEKEIIPTPIPIKENIFYRVVTGSFSERTYLNERISASKAKGYDSFPIVAEINGKTVFRCVTGSFNSRSKAQIRIDELKALGFESFIAIYEK